MTDDTGMIPGLLENPSGNGYVVPASGRGGQDYLSEGYLHGIKGL
ncbi:MAG: hypothetical protein Q8N94_05435 [Methanoregula sp.]|nr:hypothetical protein [Methanoregula sp.]